MAQAVVVVAVVVVVVAVAVVTKTKQGCEGSSTTPHNPCCHCRHCITRLDLRYLPIHK